MLSGRAKISLTHKGIITLSVALVFLFCVGQNLTAAMFDNLHGSLNVSAVQSETDGILAETLRQEYGLNWSRNLSPYLSVRSRFRYYKFNLDRAQTGQYWREEIQPFGELALNHPSLSFTSSFKRRDTRGAASDGSIINDDWGATLKSKSSLYPLVTLTFNQNHIYNKGNASTRDTKDRILRAGAAYTIGRHDIKYNLTLRQTQNVVASLDSKYIRHLAQWSFNSTLNDNRMRLGGNYSFGYQKQTDQSPTSDSILTIFPITSGLYASYADPEFGSLATANNLTDGEVSLAGQPEINIGENSNDQNIGASFSYDRPVSGLYVYTNKTSGDQTGWMVYISENNLNWTVHDLNPQSTFNRALTRYEIVFPTITTRYVKLVNDGYNEIPDVLVTEIQALFLRSETGESTRSNQSHMANVNLGYKISPRISSSVDLSAQRDFSEGLDVYSENLYYSLSLNHRPTEKLSQSLRWHQGFQDFGSSISDYKNRSLSYGIRLKPIEAVELAGALYSHQSFIGRDKEAENKSAKVNVRGLLLPGFNFSSEIGYGRNQMFLQNRKSESWNFALSFDGDMTRSLKVIITLNHRISNLIGESRKRNRDQIGLGLNFRLSRTIRIDSDFDYIADKDTYRSQEHRLNWAISKSLSFGGSARLIRSDGSGSSERYNLRLNLKFSSRTYTYLTWLLNDFSRAGGLRTDSMQLRTDSMQFGMRTGF